MNDSPPDCNRDAIEGQRRMDAAHRLLEAMREPYLLRARRRLPTVRLDRGTESTDDVRDSVMLPDGLNPVCFGTAPTRLAAAGIMERIRYAQTTRPRAKARPSSLWERVNAEAIRQWLVDHPATIDIDEPTAVSIPIYVAATCEPIPALDAAMIGVPHLGPCSTARAEV